MNNRTVQSLAVCTAALCATLAPSAHADFFFSNNTTADLWVNGVHVPPSGSYNFVPTPSQLQVHTAYIFGGLDFEAFFETLPANAVQGYADSYARAWGLPRNIVVEARDSTFGLLRTSDAHQSDSVRDVAFLGTADCQFANTDGTLQARAFAVHEQIFQDLNPDAPNYRGVVIAGDLTQRSATDELELYRASIAGNTRFVYDSVGNHDLHWGGDDFGSCCYLELDDCCNDPAPIISDITHRLHSTVKTNKTTTTTGTYFDYTFNTTAPLYSWDWHDVHFVQLGLVPGGAYSAGSLKDGYNDECGGPCPFPAFDSISFLANDLATYVGNSGRPVVLVHHYYLGDNTFAREESFTEAERAAYWNVIKDYNVAAILAGHWHAGLTSSWGIEWQPPAGASGGPSHFETFVLGAARGQGHEYGYPSGAYTEMKINGANQMKLVRRDENGTEYGSYIISFGEQTLHVDRSNPQWGVGYGYPSHPFKKLEQAVDAIASSFPDAPFDAEPPSTIQIQGGDYYETDLTLTVPDHVGEVTFTASGGPVVIGLGGAANP